MSIQIPLWALVGPLCIEEEIKGTQKQERDFMLRLWFILGQRSLWVVKKQWGPKGTKRDLFSPFKNSLEFRRHVNLIRLTSNFRQILQSFINMKRSNIMGLPTTSWEILKWNDYTLVIMENFKSKKDVVWCWKESKVYYCA